MKDKELTTPNNIQDRIYTIRGVQVMLDRDLAELYGVKSIRLREQVKRNKDKFPDDFMFQLTNSEVVFMVSQNAIPSKKHLGGHLPYVFTEQGVSMLSTVLKSKVAVEISVKIIRAFVKMRNFLNANAQIFSRLDVIETKQLKYQLETDKNFEKIFKGLEDKSLKPKRGIFYDGQIFDAYVFIADLIKSANKSIVLIDNYIDESAEIMFFDDDQKNVDEAKVIGVEAYLYSGFDEFKNIIEKLNL